MAVKTDKPEAEFLTPDEHLILNAYRELRRQESGTFFLELVGGSVQKFQLKPDYGSAQALNRALGWTRERVP